jgi:hypothetical protein
MELALVSEHLRHDKGVIWYPQRTLDYTALPSLLEHSGSANMEKLRILDPSGMVDGSYPFVKKLEGTDLANDLRWDSIKYLLKGAKSPYVSLLGLDALESRYGVGVVPELLLHIDTMRRGGHLVLLEATDGSDGLYNLSHQARLHLRLEIVNGSVMLHGIKPSTIYHCLEAREGILRWAPML